MSDFDMSVLAPKNSVATDKDTLPTGKGPLVVDSGIRTMKIDMAYFDRSKGGAIALKLVLKDTNGPFIQRDTLWVVSGDAKGNRNTYTDGEGQEHYLPGYNLANSLCRIANQKPLNQQTVEEKTIKLWDYNQGQEMPTKVQCVTSLLGAEVQVGIVKKRENKRALQAGVWVDTAEVKEKNEVDRFFDAQGRTAHEAADDAEAEFIKEWKNRYEGQVVDHYNPIPAALGSSTAPAASTSDDTPLFS